MTFLEAYDALSSPDLKDRIDGGELLIRRYGWLMSKGERAAIRRIFNDAWEQLHAKEQAA